MSYCNELLHHLVSVTKCDNTQKRSQLKVAIYKSEDWLPSCLSTFCMI